MYPARTSSLWLATSASAGASRRVGIKSCDQRCICFPIERESSIVNDGIVNHGVRVVTGEWPVRFAREPRAAISGGRSARREPLCTKRQVFPKRAPLRPCYKSAHHH